MIKSKPEGIRTLDEIRARRAQHGGLGLAEQAAKPAWWGAEGDDLAAGPADILRMIASAMNEGLPTPIAVDTRTWSAETIIQVEPPHRDDWRAWWNRHGAGPWVVTQQQRGRYAHHRSYGSWRGWRVAILHLTEEDEQ